MSLMALVELQGCGNDATDTNATADTAKPAAAKQAAAEQAEASKSGGAMTQSGRDYVFIFGSSTLYPFATFVA